ncbi:hypothetical protein F8S13_20165 [Chloroflexia bacterium SDU3-3]|nr:hypothetical protein F8S13_20165 [Chloroflexia bacterium SDU3-3]
MAFATTYRDKIRKKLRAAQGHEGSLDLRLELETAFLLLRERALGLVYEPQPPVHARGPDFAVTYTTSLTFMLEVTRLRADSGSSRPVLIERVGQSIASKLVQLLPNHSNALLIGAAGLALTAGDLQAAMLHIQQRAEANDEPFLRRHRFRDRADFFRHHQRLSIILVRGSGGPLVSWASPQARHRLPAKVHAILQRSLAI